MIESAILTPALESWRELVHECVASMVVVNDVCWFGVLLSGFFVIDGGVVSRGSSLIRCVIELAEYYEPSYCSRLLSVQV